MPVDPLVANGHVTFQTAEEHACACVPLISPMERAEDVRQALVGQRYESASHLVVCDGDVALCVALSLFAACSTSSLAAMLLPWLLDASGQDPAFGSGPLATVIQDLLLILIFFAMAT